MTDSEQEIDRPEEWQVVDWVYAGVVAFLFVVCVLAVYPW